jgi:hypothetical protein
MKLRRIFSIIAKLFKGGINCPFNSLTIAQATDTIDKKLSAIVNSEWSQIGREP